MATLGATAGQRIEVVARGPQACWSSTRCVRSPTGGSTRSWRGRPAPPPGWRGAASRRSHPRGSRLSGAAVGPGATPLALDPLIRGIGRPAPAERGRWSELPLTLVRDDVRRQRDDAEISLGREQAAIFDAHLLFLQDEALLAPTQAGIVAGQARPRRGRRRSMSCRGVGTTGGPLPARTRRRPPQRRSTGPGTDPGRRDPPPTAGRDGNPRRGRPRARRHGRARSGRLPGIAVAHGGPTPTRRSWRAPWASPPSSVSANDCSPSTTTCRSGSTAPPASCTSPSAPTISALEAARGDRPPGPRRPSQGRGTGVDRRRHPRRGAREPRGTRRHREGHGGRRLPAATASAFSGRNSCSSGARRSSRRMSRSAPIGRPPRPWTVAR